MQICTLAFFPRAFIVGIVKSARVFFIYRLYRYYGDLLHNRNDHNLLTIDDLDFVRFLSV